MDAPNFVFGLFHSGLKLWLFLMDVQNAIHSTSAGDINFMLVVPFYLFLFICLLTMPVSLSLPLVQAIPISFEAGLPVTVSHLIIDLTSQTF